MREILFRGQIRKKGEKVRLDGSPVDGIWVFGGVTQFNRGGAIIPAYECSSENGKDFTESHPPVNGFGLTKKGFESATYKKADELQEAEYRRWAEMSEDELMQEGE